MAKKCRAEKIPQKGRHPAPPQKQSAKEERAEVRPSPSRRQSGGSVSPELMQALGMMMQGGSQGAPLQGMGGM